MAPQRFFFSGHALKRGAERKITEEEFIEVVSTSNQKVKQYRGNHGGFVYLYSKKIEGRTSSIAAEVFKDSCFFITGFGNELA